MSQDRRRPRERRGAATVEFALCVPVMVMVLFAIIEFTRQLQIQQAVRLAAFEGARAGLALDAQTSDATTAATNITTAVGIKNATITVSPNPISFTSNTVQVTVSASPASNNWFLRFFSGSQPISSTIILDREIQALSNP